MPLKIAIQMDPIARIDPASDSSFRLCLEAEARGHTLFYYTPDHLSLREGRPIAHGWPIRVKRAKDFVSFGQERECALEEFDVVLLRQDPPCNMAYIATTHILERVHRRTLVVNDPVSVRNAPEKFSVFDFPEFIPPTLLTRDRDAAKAFRAAQGSIVMKPLFGNGGAGIFILHKGDRNFNALFESFLAAPEPFILQRFLPGIARGDKRVILIDGEAAGAINRLPPPDDNRSNMHVGGTPVPCTLDARDREICARLGPRLKEQGLVFVGIDVIGGYLTEINVTSPTGIQELERMGGVNAAEAFWEAVEARLTARRQA